MASNGPLRVDDLETWPPQVVHILEQHFTLLQDHAEFEAKRYAALGSGISERELVAQSNPFEAARNELLSEIETLTRDEHVIAYHCTRLTPDELAGVSERGLLALSHTIAASRLLARVGAGDLSHRDADRLMARLLGRARAAQSDRVGKIWAVSTADALQDEIGLGNPLRYWGGEGFLDLDDIDRDLLARIGSACIVEFEAPIARLVITSISSDLTEHFLRLHGGHCDEPGTVICIEGDIEPDRILNVFRRDQSEFERLTRCSEWAHHLT
jgi:hypothetical protein